MTSSDNIRPLDLQEDESSKASATDRHAAEVIQRTYRGHRTRRQLRGFGLDAQTRWHEAVRDAQYQALITPSPPRVDSNDSQPSPDEARSKWSRATKIAQRAGYDDISISEYSTSEDESNLELKRQTTKRRAEAAAKRKKTAKMMDLQYFLEMVDQKHRYGSNLRKYHAHWKQQDTQESFFYWLDHGQGKDLSIPECSRTRLETMQVRYLSREERSNYLVKINEEGLLVWAKNGELVWTKDELYKDSINGIVPANDATPKFEYNMKPGDSSDSDSDSEDEDEETIDNTAGDEGEQYVNEEFHRAKGPAKLKHVSAAVLFNHMIRKSLKKGHKWIFVADTSFRLYIGYKQSGAFQHSSFLHGSRISAAGLIKVKHGQLRSLAPLSGHYRPPAHNFRAFVHSLKEEGVDMSRVSISKSYAVLVGMEGYTKGQQRLKAAEKTLTQEFDKIVRPEKAQREADQQKDKSQSAEKERLYLEQQRLQEEQSRKGNSMTGKFSAKFSRLFRRAIGRHDSEHKANKRIPGSGPEDGIPAPDGSR